MRDEYKDAPDSGRVETTQAGKSLGAQLVRALFERHGVPERERSKIVEKVLGLSYHAAHRRVSGLLPWTIEEVSIVAAHYDESLGDLVTSVDIDEALPATFIVGGVQEQCRIWLGPALPPHSKPSLVAIRGKTGWFVKPSASSMSEAVFSIRKLILELLPEKKPRRIAVVDDNPDVANSLSDYLRAMGFESEAYLDFRALEGAMEEQPFDAYVVDWLIAGKTARPLLAKIRARDASCPILILTGQARSGGAGVAELASALAECHAILFEKPAQSPIIVAKLSEALRSLPGQQ